MSEKETNLSLSADVTTKSDLISLAKSIGDHICVLKTHIDIIEDTDMNRFSTKCVMTLGCTVFGF